MGKLCDSNTSENIKLRLLEDKLRTDLAPKDVSSLPDCDTMIDEKSQFYLYENNELRNITWKDLKNNFDLNKGDAKAITIENDNWHLNGQDTGVKARGDKGEKGDKGEPGKPGINGKDGAAGKDGAPGIDGKDGKDGAPGINGKDGKDGEPGKKGDKGDQGDKGDKGDQGNQGHSPVITIGDNGSWYIDGKETGVKAKGDKGDTGLQGERGEKGQQGEQGLPGVAGAKGDTGAQGEKGENGKDGRGIISITRSNIDQTGLIDTYAINYSDGSNPSTFTVTNGKDGINGEKGQDGITPHIGENNHWFIGEKDTNIPAIGQKGDRGETGAKGDTGPQGDRGVQGEPGMNGQDGKDGNTPIIGENGNWWINGVDTNLTAQGPQGERGPRGEKGADGIDGKPGQAGQDGKPGANGQDGKPGLDGKDGINFLMGRGIPLSELGNLDDHYLDLDSGAIYEKNSSGWTGIGNIRSIGGAVLASGGWQNVVPSQNIKEEYRDINELVKKFKNIVVTFYQKDAQPSRVFSVIVSTQALKEERNVHCAVSFYNPADTAQFEIGDAQVYLSDQDIGAIGVTLYTAYPKANSTALPSIFEGKGQATDTWIKEIVGVN